MKTIEERIDEVLETMLELMDEGGMGSGYSGKNYKTAKSAAVIQLKDLIAKDFYEYLYQWTSFSKSTLTHWLFDYLAKKGDK